MIEKVRTNCNNCGAPLHYKEKDFGKLAKCQYCDTEYHIDMLGRVEEYKVKIKIMGVVKEFYISNVICEPEFIETYRTLDGRLERTIPHSYRTEITLIEI